MIKRIKSTLRELSHNMPALFGLIYILICFVCVILGYSIMLDKTPNVDDGHPMIRKLPPLSTAYILKMKRSFESKPTSFFESLYFGTDSDFTIVPLAGSFEDTVVLKISHDTVYFKTYDTKGNNTLLAKPLIECVKLIYNMPSPKLVSAYGKNYQATDEGYYFLDSREEIQYVSKEELLKEFWNNHVEKRFFPLGTDEAGRDVYSKLIYGTRIALLVGFASVLISLIVGVTLGALAGFFGGIVDSIISWLITVFFAIPSIMWVIAISFVLGSRELWVVFVAIGLTTWVDIARLVRGQIISIKESLFIDAAHALGYSNQRIVFNHILPNVIDPLIVASTSNFATAILVESGLSFLGIGVRPPTPSWGYMIYEGFKSIGSPNSLHLILVPCIAISLMILSFNLLGNGLRDALDPKKSLKG